MKLYVQYGEELSSQWQRVCELDLKPGVGSHPQSMATSRDVLGLNPESIVLPNGEQLEISAYYSLGNRGISINIVGNDKTLIQVGGFKHSETSYDPSVIFLTPKGLYLSLLVGQ